MIREAFNLEAYLKQEGLPESNIPRVAKELRVLLLRAEQNGVQKGIWLEQARRKAEKMTHRLLGKKK